MNAPLKIALASTIALATAAPAMAQYQPSDPQYQRPDQSQQQPSQYQGQGQPPGSQYQPTQQYQQDQQRYQNDRARYDADRADYRANRADYDAARGEYDRRRADWEASRARYDARYGSGAYIRVYGAAPVWDTTRWGPYDVPPAAGYYGRDTAYTADCRSNNNSAVTAGIIGALAGAALGSNVAAHGVRTEGAVLGGVVGAGVGAAVGNAHDRYKCDSRGPYFSYNETIPYREAAGYGSGRYGDYQRMRCRLVSAPVDRDSRDYRYIRVCPDSDGRYRING
jgi:hypothetical protein